MSKLQITYDGSQHCTALQKAQGKTVAIDCPYAGGKEFFSYEFGGSRISQLHAVIYGNPRSARSIGHFRHPRGSRTVSN